MSYLAIEISEYSGEPIELYTFSYQGEVYRYTSADRDIIHDFQTFTSLSVSRGKQEINSDITKNPITVDLSLNADFATLFISSPPTSLVDVVMQRYHVTDTLGEVIIFYNGRAIDFDYKENYVKIKCESIHTSFKRNTLRRRYQKNCPYILYNNQCKVVASSFVEAATLSGASGSTLTSTTFGLQTDGYFSGGYVTYTVNGITNSRFIIGHVGDVIQVLMPDGVLEVGLSVDVYPGCDRAFGTCNTKFANKKNYGGFIKVPEKNPFGGSPIF